MDAGTNRVLLLLGLSVVINYIDRSNLSIAAPLIKDEIGITAAQLGTLLSAFFWTYSVMHLVSGWLVDHFDVKWVFGLGFLAWSGTTAITGLLHGFAALLAARIVLGLGEAVSFPSYGKIICTYFDEEHRGFANAVIVSGLALGPAAGFMVGGSVVSRFGWRPFFIVVGVAGLLWLLPWASWMPGRDAALAEAPSPFSGMFAIVRRRSAWGMWICHFALAYPLYFLLTWLPFYLNRARGLSLNQTARIAAAVFLTHATSSAVVGKLADRWIATGSSVTLIRKTLAVVGSILVGLFLVAAVLAPANLYAWMLVLVGASMGFTGTCLYSAAQTLAGPRMAGRWTGLQQCMGNLSGAAAPAATGFLLQRTGNFHSAFYLAALVSVAGAFSWLVVVGPLQTLQWKDDPA